MLRGIYEMEKRLLKAIHNIEYVHIRSIDLEKVSALAGENIDEMKEQRRIYIISKIV